MEQAHARESEQLSDQVSLLLTLLNGVNRGPKGLSDLWKSTQQALPNSVEKTLLEAGFEVWLAYICVKRGAEKAEKFAGKAACRDLVTNLGTQPPEYLKSLAAAVARGIAPNIQAKVKELERRINANMSQQSSKRQRTTDNSSATSESGDHPIQQSIDDFPKYPADFRQVLVNVSLGSLHVFPPDFSDIVKRVTDPKDADGLVAAIAMSFPRTEYAERIGCQMTIEIAENQVEWIVGKLFGVRVETNEGLRYIRMPDGGAHVLPNPDLIIRGCPFGEIPFFGPELQYAIEMSPASRDDIRRKASRASAVSVLIRHQANQGAQICLLLGLWHGTEIKKKLYNT